MQINPFNVAAGSMGSYTGDGAFGFNDDIDTTEETVWSQGGIYSYLTSAETLTLSSADAADAGDGTGARTVTIRGLNADLLRIQEEITLNGQTGVATTNQFYRVYDITVNTAGSGGQNAGIVYAGTGTITAGAPANVYAAVPAGKNLSSMCVWTVPKGVRAFVTGIFTSTQKNSSNTATIRAVARPLGGVFETRGEFVISQPGGPIVAPLSIPAALKAGTDIEIRSTASANNTDVTASIGLMVGP